MNNLKNYTNQMKKQGDVLSIIELFIRKTRYVIVINLDLSDINITDPIKQQRVDYCFAKLKFYKNNANNKKLEVLIDNINMYQLDGEYMDYQTLKEYFGSYDNALGQINQSIVKEINNQIDFDYQFKNREEIRNIVNRNNLNDIDFFSRIYITHVMKLSENKRRTLENENKCKIYANDVYNEFKSDKRITFCWSDNPDDLRTLEEIRDLYIKNCMKRN